MVGLLVVVFALGVQMPRIMFAFAMTDNLIGKLGEENEYNLLMTSAVMGAFVLTLGNAYLAHILAQRSAQRDALWIMTALAWGTTLIFSVIIIAPSLRVGLDKSPLASVLQEPWHLDVPVMRWLYCIVLALAFELLAAGSMAAYALASRETAEAPRKVQPTPDPIKVEPAPLPVPATPPVLPNPHSIPVEVLPPVIRPGLDWGDETGYPETLPPILDDIDQAILNIYRANPAATKEFVAQQVTLTVRPVTRQTVGNRLKKLQERGLVTVNGVVTVHS
jgi:MFS family permease